MHSLEPELRELHAAGLIDGDTAARAVALQRGEVLSVFEELRAALYAGVALVMSGMGIVLARNLARIGPLTIMAVLALLAEPVRLERPSHDRLLDWLVIVMPVAGYL